MCRDRFCAMFGEWLKIAAGCGKSPGDIEAILVTYLATSRATSPLVAYRVFYSRNELSIRATGFLVAKRRHVIAWDANPRFSRANQPRPRECPLTAYAVNGHSRGLLHAFNSQAIRIPRLSHAMPLALITRNVTVINCSNRVDAATDRRSQGRPAAARPARVQR